MRVWGDRYSRDLQRYTLAWRMLGHDARTQTIAAWTGLPKDRIRTLNRSHAPEPSARLTVRHRGPSPHSVAYFLRSAQLRSEAAALAGLFYAFNLLPERPIRHPSRELPGVARGERLCDAFEMYRSLLPDSVVTLEHVVMLLTAVAQGSDLLIEHCKACDCAMVLDRYGNQRKRCSYCVEAGVRVAVTGLRAREPDRSPVMARSPTLAGAPQGDDENSRMSR